MSTATEAPLLGDVDDDLEIDNVCFDVPDCGPVLPLSHKRCSTSPTTAHNNCDSGFHVDDLDATLSNMSIKADEEFVTEDEDSHDNITTEHDLMSDECYVSLDDSQTTSSRVSLEDDFMSALLVECEQTLRPIEGISLLVERLYQQDSESNTVLHWTIALGKVEASLAIIARTPAADLLEIRNDLRQTPVILALLTQQPAVLEALAEAGADLTKVDRHGNSCFHIAARTGDLDSIMVLKSFMTSRLRAVLNQHNSNGLCPVHIAIIEGHIHVFEFLKRMGANIDRMDAKAGFTPIHHAIRVYGDSNHTVMRYLVEQAKVDLSATDFSDRTPLMMAEGYRCIETVVYLSSKGPGKEWLSCPPFSDHSSDDEEDFIAEDDEGICR